MTRRLGGIGSKGLAALASLSLATTLAGGFAITGCGGDNGSPTTNPDGGMDSNNLPDVTPDRGQDVTMPEAGMDVVQDRGPDVTPDVTADTNPPPPDAADAMPPAQCGAVTFNPNGGMIMQGQTVTLSAPTGFPATGDIFYTTDGTMPTHSSKFILGTSGMVQVNASETIYAIAFAQGVCEDSTPTMAAFVVQTPPPPDAGGPPAIPAFNPTTTTSDNDISVTLTSAGATICYTFAASTPACTSGGGCAGGATTYTGPVLVDRSATNTYGVANLAAIACNSVGSSAVAQQSYTLQAGTPQFSNPSPGNVNFPGATPTIGTTTTGGTIYYTTSGTVPSCNPPTGTLINASSGTVSITQNTTIQAIACKQGYAPSPVSAATTYNVLLGAATFSPAPTNPIMSATPTLTITNPNTSGGTLVGNICWSNDPNNPPGCNGSTCTGTGVNTVATATATPTLTDQETVQAIVCASGYTPQAAPASSGPYTLKLDNVAFSPGNGAAIPVAGLDVIVHDSICTATSGAKSPGTCTDTSGDQGYTGLCYTVDGNDVAPSATCTTMGGTTCVAANTTTIHLTAATTIKAIGCTVGWEATQQQANYGSSTQMASPSISVAAGSYSDDQGPVTFTNNDSSEVAYFCYSTTAPSSLTMPTCGAMGSAGCTSTSVAPGASSSSTDANAPMITATETLYAWACDAGGSSVRTPSIVQSASYTMNVAAVTIAPASGATVNVGQAITFTSSTYNTGSTNVVNYCYTIDGSTPACGSGSCIAGTNDSSTAPTKSSATYTILGTETPGIKVRACKTGYTQTAVASATYTIQVAPPVLAYGTGTYDDTLTEGIQVSPSSANANTWLCYNTGGTATCGTSPGNCGAGTGVANASLSNGACAAPSGATNALTGKCTTLPITTTGTALSVRACSQPGLNGSLTVLSSTAVTGTYTLDVSAIAFNPSAAAQTASISPKVGLAGATIAPNGTGTTGGATICWTTDTGPTQPASCPAAGATPADGTGGNWTCGSSTTAADGSTSFTMQSDVGVNTAFTAFACKTGLVPTANANIGYTFTGCVHSTISFTGNLATDFSAATEQIGTADGSSKAYVSWDATNLYIGFDTGSFAPGGTTFVHFYAGGTSGTTSGDTTHVNDGRSLPAATFNAEYHVWYGSDGSFGIDDWSTGGGTWGAASTTGTATLHATNTSVYEIQVPLSAFGTPTTLRILGGASGGGATFGAWPTSNADTGNWTSWQTEYLNECFAPNDANNLNK